MLEKRDFKPFEVGFTVFLAVRICHWVFSKGDSMPTDLGDLQSTVNSHANLTIPRANQRSTYRRRHGRCGGVRGIKEHTQERFDLLRDLMLAMHQPHPTRTPAFGGSHFDTH